MSDLDPIGRSHAELTRRAFDNLEPPQLDLSVRSGQAPARRVLVAAVAAVAVIVLMLPVLLLGGPREPAGVTAPGTTPMVPSGDWIEVRGGPSVGISAWGYEVRAWTGSEIVIWGGWVGDEDVGAAFNPSTGEWRSISPGPLIPSHLSRFPGWVWTGDSLLIWADGRAAAWDPESNTWEDYGEVPLLAGSFHRRAVWTGAEVIDTLANIAFDPATRVTRQIASPPLEGSMLAERSQAVWTGDRVILLPSGVIYDPENDSWSPGRPSGLSPNSVDGVFVNGMVVAADYLLNAAIYDVGQDRWRELPPIPLSSGECPIRVVAVAGVPVVDYCGAGAFLDWATETWVPFVSLPDLSDADPPRLLATGAHLYSYGERGLWRFDGIAMDPGTSELFAPPFTVENGVYTFTVQMVNGEWLTMTLPESLGSQIEGFESGVALGNSDEMWTGVQVNARYGTSHDLYKGRVPIETYVDGGGRPVRLYRNDDGHNELVFQFGPWSLIAPGGGGVGLGSERFASVIDGHVTDEGFLVLTPRELELQLPTHSIPNASFISSNRNSVVWFWRFHPGRCLSSEPEFTPESGITSICDPASGDRLMLGSAAEFTNEELDAISFAVTTDRPDR